MHQRAYPFFKEVAAFYESYLIEDEEGVLQIVPSQSPENRFVGGGELPVTLCVSATMDVLLARQALEYARRTAALLGVDEEKQQVWAGMVERLPPIGVGRFGQIVCRLLRANNIPSVALDHALEQIENLRRILDYRDLWLKLLEDISLAAAALELGPSWRPAGRTPRDLRRAAHTPRT